MIQDTHAKAPELHIFVCVNDRALSESTMPSCGPRMTREDVKKLKLWIRQEGLLSRVMVTATGCLGYCSEDSCTIAVYPEGRFYKGVQSIEDIKKLIQERIEGFA